MSDPLATPDQAACERLALRLFEHPAIRQAREEARTLLLTDPVAASRDGRLGLERALDLWTLALCMREANGDPARPMATWNVDNAPREWFGHIYPGGAVAVDNPDNINREMPLDGDGRYELDIQLGENPSSLSLVLEEEPAHHAGIGRNIGALPWLALHPDAEGRITVTVDSDPANGRPHHLQGESGRLQLYARDSMADWTMTPARIAIRRLDAPPGSARTEADIIAAIVDALPHWIVFWSGFKNDFLGYPEPNRLIGPQGRVGGWGFLAGGRFAIAEGEAVLITVDTGGAAYVGFQVADPWTIAPDPAHRQPSLNLAQATPNADGSITYAVAPVDPGVANWIDTVGLAQGWLLLRWQGVPPDADPATFIREVRLVDADEARTAAPAIDLDGRRAALTLRARLHHARTAAGRKDYV